MNITFIEMLTAVTLLVDFLLGVTFGVVGGATYGSRLEDALYSLLGTAPDRVGAGARRIFGLSRVDDGYLAYLLRHGREVTGNGAGLRADDPGAERKDYER